MMRCIGHFTLSRFRKEHCNTHDFFRLFNMEFTKRRFINHEGCEWLCPCLPCKKSHEVACWNAPVSRMQHFVECASIISFNGSTHERFHRMHNRMLENIAFCRWSHGNRMPTKQARVV